ncbi:MAG: 3-isopropylmalate dehydratase large subunit [Thermoanaerobaculia bacterium]|nr:3-isopropylmalate dehydratase large subunit [Thermoanaerobaculia bacterium]
MTSNGTGQPQTLFEKIWRRHEVVAPEEPGLPSILYVDLHLVHEVTSPQAFAELEQRSLSVRRPGRTLATMDHSTPTDPEVGWERLRVLDPAAAGQLDQLVESCWRHGVPLLALGDSRRGIVHVVGPELGATQPGSVIVCGDSHTSTHGAFGALAFGIGTTEVGHVLATQCLLQRKPKTMEVHVRGSLADGVGAKDLILGIIAAIGVDGGTGHVIEYTGETVRSLDMEGRMTVCNMSIEAGARAGMISPDDVTLSYLRDRPFVPTGSEWTRAEADWRSLATDDGASFDRRVELEASSLEPMITWGVHPGTAVPVSGRIPQLEDVATPQRPNFEKALRYMGFQAGEELRGRQVDVVFVGSCTNSRLSDLETAAQVMEGRRVAPGVRMLVVPGSQQVKAAAEAEGLDQVFLAAGAEWREAGCSMCLAMNDDRLRPGQLAVSTSNRNFEGRQGPGGRTLLASPLTAAAAAVAGHVTDPRELM